ncbi:uncharacterized protein [Panulirus ornatus]|uniref:uncharacterized protein n=1 Tax=Panulirus ornatus TaxID=150431 RepID=UPI003A8BF127
MKVLVLFALVAFATAKPQYWWPHTTPLVTVKSTDVASPIIPYAGLPWTHGLFPYSLMAAAKPAEERAKRSAEADPEADPQILYTSSMSYPYAGNAWAYHGPWTWPYGVNPLLTVAKPAEETRAKRSADAEPEADPFLLYSLELVTLTLATPGPTTLSPTTGTMAVLFALVACAAAQSQWWPYSTPASTVKSADITPSIIPYAGIPWTQGVFPYNYPIVAAANPTVRAKRSADAEADPQILYTSSMNYPYASNAWSYHGFPYNWNYGMRPLLTVAKPAEAPRAKRSADADADADADPYMFYSSAMTYPYTGYPWTYNNYPYTWPYAANPTLRAKRSADAEPEADPYMFYNSPATYPYSGYSWGYNTYPYTWPYGVNPIV